MQPKTLISTIVFCFFLFLSNAAMAKVPLKVLKFEDIAYSQLPRQRAITGMWRSGTKLFTLGDEAAILAVNEVKLEDKRFLEDSTFEVPETTSYPFAKSVPKGRWRGVVPFLKNTLLLLNGTSGTLMAVDGEKFEHISHRQIAMDTFRPPRDSRGEPTRREIAAARGKFRRALTQAQREDVIAAGITLMPESWRGGEKRQEALLLLRVKNFPLMTMTCDQGDVTQCILARNCYVHGLEKVNHHTLSGLAVSSKRQRLFIGDQDGHRLWQLRFRSCYDVVVEREIRLPEKINKLANIYVDDEDNLWVGTLKPDNYRNGSLYMWKKDSW